MKKLMVTMTATSAVMVMSASGAAAGGPTCEDMFGTGWKNHGEHVLTYVNDGGAGGGQPAHRDSAPAPGASFCLDQSKSPGLHF